MEAEGAEILYQRKTEAIGFFCISHVEFHFLVPMASFDDLAFVFCELVRVLVTSTDTIQDEQRRSYRMS
jgi:hypothetical protein